MNCISLLIIPYISLRHTADRRGTPVSHHASYCVSLRLVALLFRLIAVRQGTTPGGGRALPRKHALYVVLLRLIASIFVFIAARWGTTAWRGTPSSTPARSLSCLIASHCVLLHLIASSFVLLRPGGLLFYAGTPTVASHCVLLRLIAARRGTTAWRGTRSSTPARPLLCL